MSAPWYEVAFDRLYPVLYPHRDEAEARRVVESFAGIFSGDGVVLDLACGDGRYVEALGAAGLDVRGVDLSAFLLGRAASERGLAGRVVRGDLRHLPFRSAGASGAISMFTSFGYFETEADNRYVLEEVARVLAPGGVFLFDFVNAGRVASGLTAENRSERGGYAIEERRSLEADGRFVVKRVVATPLDGGEAVRYEERVRLYRPAELEGMLADARLEVARRYGDYDGGDFDESASERVIMVCERV